ncbi:MAG TPA: hypothetical protein VGZ73_03915, partial [Bryobacteraceae bacterium]|nr:hypothetical protein [Bryobacteraceae bacterium]
MLAVLAKYSFMAYAFRHLDRHFDALGPAVLGDNFVFDRDERGELRHEAIVETELRDLLFQFRLHRSALETEPVLRPEIVNAASGPEARERFKRWRAGGERDWDVAGEGTSGARSLEAHGAGRGLGVAAGEDDGLSAEKIGQALRIDIGDGQAAPINIEIGQQGRAHALLEAVCRLVGLIGQRDVFDGTTSRLGHFVEQETIHGGADAE